MQAGGGETLGSFVAPAQARGDGAPSGVGIPTQKSTLTVGHASGQGGRVHACRRKRASGGIRGWATTYSGGPARAGAGGQVRAREGGCARAGRCVDAYRGVGYSGS